MTSCEKTRWAGLTDGRFGFPYNSNPESQDMWIRENYPRVAYVSAVSPRVAVWV